MMYKLENEVEKEISIDQCHHWAIIEVKGEIVRELQETYNVQIIFSSSGYFYFLLLYFSKGLPKEKIDKLLVPSITIIRYY